MNARATHFLNAFLGLIALTGTVPLCCQADEPWTDKELKDPAALAATLADAKAPKPAIFNIGPVQDIKGAISIGPTVGPENLEKLKQMYTVQLQKLTALRHGHRFSSKKLENGKVQVTITV